MNIREGYYPPGFFDPPSKLHETGASEQNNQNSSRSEEDVNRKVCPIASSDDPNRRYINCCEEACAWWIEVDEKCSIPVIARNLELLDCRIDSLAGVVDRR